MSARASVRGGYTPVVNADEIHLTPARWQAFLDGLYERDERLERREAGHEYPPEEAVDAYVLSAHAEALQSSEVDGDVWGTLEDLDETAGTEEEAWAKVRAFYLERDCVLVVVDGLDEPEEWLLTRTLAGRLGLLGG